MCHDGREGWAPSSYLEPLEPTGNTEEEKVKGQHLVPITSKAVVLLAAILYNWVPLSDRIYPFRSFFPSPPPPLTSTVSGHSLPSRPGQVYKTRESYAAQLDDEISFPENASVEVIEKSITGWWHVR